MTRSSRREGQLKLFSKAQATSESRQTLREPGFWEVGVIRQPTAASTIGHFAREAKAQPMNWS